MRYTVRLGLSVVVRLLLTRVKPTFPRTDNYFDTAINKYLISAGLRPEDGARREPGSVIGFCVHLGQLRGRIGRAILY